MTEREIGALEARVETLETMVTETRADVKVILAHVEAAKGGWRMLSTLAVIMTTLGAGVATLVGLFKR